jgi:hypothetical protein
MISGLSESRAEPRFGSVAMSFIAPSTPKNAPSQTPTHIGRFDNLGAISLAISLSTGATLLIGCLVGLVSVVRWRFSNACGWLVVSLSTGATLLIDCLSTGATLLIGARRR